MPKPLKKPLTEVENILEAYPSEKDFLSSKLYNPDGQNILCGNTKDCWFGAHPTLSLLDRAYKKPVGEAWLIPQLANISEYAGTKEKLTKQQIKDCAFAIRNNYGFLKISEFMLFCNRFKAGIYGDFYGAVSPLTITAALRLFMNDRSAAIEKMEQERREAELEEQKNGAISYEEYCRMKRQDQNTSPLERIYKKFEGISDALK